MLPGASARPLAGWRHGLPHAFTHGQDGLPAHGRASPRYPSRSPIAPTTGMDRVIVHGCRSGANTTSAGTPSRLEARPSTFFRPRSARCQPEAGNIHRVTFHPRQSALRPRRSSVNQPAIASLEFRSVGCAHGCRFIGESHRIFKVQFFGGMTA